MWGNTPVYICTHKELLAEGKLPEGYSVAGVVLEKQWSAINLTWLLNCLFGGQFADAPYQETGARAFAFFGERADEAHTLCDALRDAWNRRHDGDDRIILTVGSDSDSVADFVCSVVFALSPAAAYAGQEQYRLCVVPDETWRQTLLAEMQVLHNEIHPKASLN